MDITLTLSPFSNPKIYEKKIIELNKKIGINIQLNSKIKTVKPRFNIKATNNDITFDELVNRFKKLGIYIFESKFYVNDEPSNNFNVHSNYTGFIDFTLEYNLLIIGNGFDIGHGLKTKYTDFLQQINILNEILNRGETSNKINTHIKYNNDCIDEKNIKTAFNNIFNILFKSNNVIDTTLDKTLDRLFKLQDICNNFKNKVIQDVTLNVLDFKKKYIFSYNNHISLLNLSCNILTNILEDIHNSFYIKKSHIISNLIKDNSMKIKWFLAENHISNNLLIQYLLDKYNTNTISGNNWIDIEAELFTIIKTLETIQLNYNTSSFNIHELTVDSSLIKFLLKFFETNTNLLKYNEAKFRLKIKKLEQDLDNFIFLLCSYLLSVEEDFIYSNSHQQLRDIYRISHTITHLLSFNYTDTFKKIYTKPTSNFYEKSNKHIKDYIYVDFIHGNISNNNLVLGISETLSPEIANTEHSFIYFKKYFQRIYKKTGAKYTNWLKNVTFNTVYIYGHSLDITDKEILFDIMTHQNVKKIIIFYYDETHYRQEISNLVKILDKNTFLNYVAEHKIIFKKQSNLHYKPKT